MGCGAGGYNLRQSSPTRGELRQSDFAYDPETDVPGHRHGSRFLRQRQRGPIHHRYLRPRQHQPAERRPVPDPGWPVGVGLDNYTTVLTDPGVRSNFMPILIWSFIVRDRHGADAVRFRLLLALVMQDKRMKGQRFYRLALVLPTPCRSS